MSWAQNCLPCSIHTYTYDHSFMHTYTYICGGDAFKVRSFLPIECEHVHFQLVRALLDVRQLLRVTLTQLTYIHTYIHTYKFNRILYVCMYVWCVLLSRSNDCCKAFSRECSLFNRSFSSPPEDVCMYSICSCM